MAASEAITFAHPMSVVDIALWATTGSLGAGSLTSSHPSNHHFKTKVRLRRPANPCGPLDGVSAQYFTPAARLTGCSPIFVSFDSWKRRGTDDCSAIVA